MMGGKSLGLIGLVFVVALVFYLLTHDQAGS
jgi:hypothetical protein